MECNGIRQKRNCNKSSQHLESDSSNKVIIRKQKGEVVRWMDGLKLPLRHRG